MHQRKPSKWAKKKKASHAAFDNGKHIIQGITSVNTSKGDKN